ncbi:L-serine ammonia-lyase [Salmonella enterica]
MESIREIFTVTIGPSASRTTGPMNAAYRFMKSLRESQYLSLVTSVDVIVYGNLSLCGVNHHVNVGIILGLCEFTPERADNYWPLIKEAGQHSRITVDDRPIGIRITFSDETHPYHPYAMKFVAYDGHVTISCREYFSVGGGRVRDAGETAPVSAAEVRFPFSTGESLLAVCRKHGLSIPAVMMKNEKMLSGDPTDYIMKIWGMMKASIDRGLSTEGILPGPHRIRRSAYTLAKKARLSEGMMGSLIWVNVFAVAAAEENAGGGKTVTGPTNGSAGVLPAVLLYYDEYVRKLGEKDIVRFFLTAGAVAILFKQNASILGTEVGCQGEIGVAASMAAAGLAELMGGTPARILDAAEIAMEQHIGLTCDPVGGQVQVPCIQRNAVSALKAVNAASLALCGDGQYITLDECIRSMYETGKDMSVKYRESYHAFFSSLKPERPHR